MSEISTWCDVESTGTEPFTGDELLEVAVLMTDENFNVLDEDGYHAVIKYSPLAVTRMKLNTSDFVLDMHRKTGLWDKLVEGTDKRTVDAELFEYIKSFVPEANTSRIAGNSITLDRNFLNANLPKSFGHLSYRSYDISTLAGLVKNWKGEDVVYKKKLNHSAMDDIRESIEEVKFLKRALLG